MDQELLTDCKQKVVLNGSHSDWTEVTSGIPQGSVLDPILFTIYINDLPDVLYNMAKIFADDIKLYAIVNNDEERTSLQNDIDRLVQWSKDWLLKFNTSKCKDVHFGPETNATYKMEEKNITKSDEEKDLGIIIDGKLKFRQHINIQTKKVNQKLGMIKRSFCNMDKGTTI